MVVALGIGLDLERKSYGSAIVNLCFLFAFGFLFFLFLVSFSEKRLSPSSPGALSNPGVLAAIGSCGPSGPAWTD